MSGDPIEHVSLADAKRRLDELVARAAGGETIVIERADGAAARLQPEASPRPTGAYDWDEHWDWLKRRPMDTRPQQTLIDEWRGGARY